MSLELVSWLSLMEKDYKALPKRKVLLPKCVCYLMHKHGITVTHIRAYTVFASNYVNSVKTVQSFLMIRADFCFCFAYMACLGFLSKHLGDNR